MSNITCSSSFTIGSPPKPLPRKKDTEPKGIAWLRLVDNIIPDDAVKANDDGNAVLYVARTQIFGELIPGKLVVGDGCYVSYGGEEYKAAEFEVLVITSSVTYGWESNSLGVVPKDALCGGHTSNGEPLFVGRGILGTASICGKISRIHGCLYVGFVGKEHPIQEYEVLVLRAPLTGIKWITPGKSQMPGTSIIASAVGEKKIYVARAAIFGGVFPGKLVLGEGCYITYHNEEHKADIFQVLTIEDGVSYEWEPNSDGRVSRFSLTGGFSSHGEVLYIGRGVNNSTVLCGKIQLSHGCLLVSNGGKEQRCLDYDVLVIKPHVEGIKWVSTSSAVVPENAVLAGLDDGLSLYVARGTMFGDILPGKLVDGTGCYVTYAGEEYKAPYCEILSISEKVPYDWEPNYWGGVSRDALCGGVTSYGEQLYIGRGVLEDATLCGKVHRSQGCLFVGRGGKEHSITNYEVLVIKSNVEGVDWVTGRDDTVPENAVRVGFDGVDVVYVGRAAMFGDVIPGKFIPSEGCYVSHSGKEQKATEYEVLTISSEVNYDWEVHIGCGAPKNALVCGLTANGEQLYVGRGFCKEATISGKIQKGKCGLMVGYEGQEYTIEEYEVLIIKPATQYVYSPSISLCFDDDSDEFAQSVQIKL